MDHNEPGRRGIQVMTETNQKFRIEKIVNAAGVAKYSVGISDWSRERHLDVPIQYEDLFLLLTTIEKAIEEV